MRLVKICVLLFLQAKRKSAQVVVGRIHVALTTPGLPQAAALNFSLKASGGTLL